MNERKNISEGRGELYSLVKSLKDEIARLSTQIRAMRNELEGVKKNEN